MTDEIARQILSPEVHADRSVTFRLRSKQAQQVLVKGLDGHPPISMQRVDDELWEGQSQPLVPELYGYEFEVDGTRMADPSNRDVKKWLSCESMVEVKGAEALDHEMCDVPHGVIHRHFYWSNTVSQQRGVYVYTPPGNIERQPRNLPFLVLMHGFGDDESAWLEVGRANFIADNLIAQGRMRPCVIVMPYGHPKPIDLSVDFDEYAAANQAPLERDLCQDLMPGLDKIYSLSADRAERGIAGLSMGGGQALHVGLKNLDIFSKVGAFSSAAPMGSGDAINAALGGFPAHEANLRDRLALLWIACGEDDFLLDRNQHFVDWLKTWEVDHTFEITSGGHDWIVWRKYLSRFLQLAFPV